MGALDKKVQVNDKLKAITGSSSVARKDIVKKFWAYAKKHNVKDGRDIHVGKDAKLAALFPGKKKITMFEVMGGLNKHIKR